MFIWHRKPYLCTAFYETPICSHGDTARNLTSVYYGGVTTSYKYNADGLRTEKQYGTTTYKYYYDGDKLLRQEWGPEHIDFLYDASGEVYGFVYEDIQYFYVKNAQGDVLQIRSKWGTTLVEYEYDAWGNCSIVYTHSAYGSFGEINPIRYRSYFYDFETGFYYLQSRYYDPAIRRFINTDTYISTGQDFLGFNMYAYCLNAPVDKKDVAGYMCVDCFDEDGNDNNDPRDDIAGMNGSAGGRHILTRSLNPTHSLTRGRNAMRAFINQVKQNGITESIKYVSFNNSYYVVDGHHRLAAAIQLGWSTVPAQEVTLPYLSYKTIDDLFDWNGID